MDFCFDKLKVPLNFEQLKTFWNLVQFCYCTNYIYNKHIQIIIANIKSKAEVNKIRTYVACINQLVTTFGWKFMSIFKMMTGIAKLFVKKLFIALG